MFSLLITLPFEPTIVLFSFKLFSLLLFSFFFSSFSLIAYLLNFQFEFRHFPTRKVVCFLHLLIFFFFIFFTFYICYLFFPFFFICWSSVCTSFLLLICHSVSLCLTSFKWIYRCLSFSYVSPFFPFFFICFTFLFLYIFRLILFFLFYYFHLSFLWYLLFLFIFSNNFSLIFISYLHSFSTTELFPGSFLSSTEPLSFTTMYCYLSFFLE